MERPCDCCVHYWQGEGDSYCIRCKHSAEDNFLAGNKCASCQYDPRLHGICKRCVDYDQYTPNATHDGRHPRRTVDGFVGQED